MAPGRACVILVILLVVTVSKAMPISEKGIACVPPFVLRGITPANYVEDTTGENKCPEGFLLFGDLCAHLHPFGKPYSNPPEIVQVDFETAVKTCERRNATIASMRELANPNVMKATEYFLQAHGTGRYMLMDKFNSCVSLSHKQDVWGQQFCAGPCSAKHKMKMIICTLPCEHDHAIPDTL